MDKWEQQKFELCNSRITDKERYILTAVYGDGKPIADIAKEYGVTRERIRQTLARVQRKIRRYYPDITQEELTRFYSDHR